MQELATYVYWYKNADGALFMRSKETFQVDPDALRKAERVLLCKQDGSVTVLKDRDHEPSTIARAITTDERPSSVVQETMAVLLPDTVGNVLVQSAYLPPEATLEIRANDHGDIPLVNILSALRIVRVNPDSIDVQGHTKRVLTLTVERIPTP